MSYLVDSLPWTITLFLIGWNLGSYRMKIKKLEAMVEHLEGYLKNLIEFNREHKA